MAGAGAIMDGMAGTRDLKVWQRARSLVLECYALSRDFPREELFGLTSQLRRAAVSVVANIAEGHGRRYRKEFLQFLSHAEASLREVDTLLVLSADLCYGNTDRRSVAESLAQETGRMLTGLRMAVERRLRRKEKAARLTPNA